MISAIEDAPTPDSVAVLDDQSRPVRERLAQFGRAAAVQNPGDTENLAMFLEFFAALLRAPDALQRYSTRLESRLQELADADKDEPSPGITTVQAWAVGYAMLAGLEIYQHLAPGLITPEVFERALGLLADFYQEQ